MDSRTGHAGIEGNEIADGEGKKYSKLPSYTSGQSNSNSEQCKEKAQKIGRQRMAASMADR